jgi:hypothetical protein
MSECVLRVTAFAEFAVQTADAAGDALLTTGFAVSATCFSIVGQLAFQPEAFAKARKAGRAHL